MHKVMSDKCEIKLYTSMFFMAVKKERVKLDGGNHGEFVEGENHSILFIRQPESQARPRLHMIDCAMFKAVCCLFSVYPHQHEEHKIHIW